ncbi:hypothetical protein N9Y92_02350 [Chlamydiales bacterium]|nr:hypothetical protein [Chlamydiales bacterium]
MLECIRGLASFVEKEMIASNKKKKPNVVELKEIKKTKELAKELEKYRKKDAYTPEPFWKKSPGAKEITILEMDKETGLPKKVEGLAEYEMKEMKSKGPPVDRGGYMPITSFSNT